MITPSLALALILATAPAAPLELRVGEPFIPTEPGAFVTKPRAAVMLAAFERERDQAAQCLAALEKYEKPDNRRSLAIAFGIGVLVGGAAAAAIILAR